MEDEKLKILAAFDLETTGLDPAVHDIIEIAIVNSHCPSESRFQTVGTAGIHSPDKSRPSRECRS